MYSKEVKRRAYHYLVSNNRVLFNRPYKYDRRTNIGHATANLIFLLERSDENLNAGIIKRKRTERRQLKIDSTFVPLFETSLMRDIRNNHLICATPEKLTFIGGRNRYPRTPQERRIFKWFSSK